MVFSLQSTLRKSNFDMNQIPKENVKKISDNYEKKRKLKLENEFIHKRLLKICQTPTPLNKNLIMPD